MSTTQRPLVAIGIGNILLRDDGIGVHVIEELRLQAALDPDRLPEGTRLVDGGTLGIGLIDHLEDARGLLIVDAVDLGLAPGTVTVYTGAPNALGETHGMHGVTGLLEVARLVGDLPAVVAFVGIQVAEIGIDTEPTPSLRAALPHAVDVTRQELFRLDAAAARESVFAERPEPVGAAG